MKIEVEEIDSCNKKLKFEIPHQDYKNKIQSYYQKLGKEVKIRGFRKGKVPISILEKQFGPEVKKEALSELIHEWMTTAIREKGLQTVSAPKLLEVEAEEGTDINVSASLEVLPEFEIKDYSDLEVAIQVPRVTDEEVDQVIESYRRRAAKSVRVTDRPAQNEDYLEIDFLGTLNGKPFEGGEAKDYIIQVGTKQLIEDLENALLGMNVGERKDAKVNIPDTYFKKEIAGKEVNFDITLKGIQVKVPPELNDEFARQVNPDKKYENLQDMKDKIRLELEEHEKNQARKLAQKQLAEKITEANPIDMPEGLVQEQIRFMIQQEKTKQDPAAAQDSKQDRNIQVTPEDETKHRAPALKILQQELVIDKLATDLNMDVSEEELNAEIQNFSKLMGGGNVEKMKKEWAKSGALVRLHTKMRREKTLSTLLDKVKVKEEMVDRSEIIQHN